jgi:hypothetical protein
MVAGERGQKPAHRRVVTLATTEFAGHQGREQLVLFQDLVVLDRELVGFVGNTPVLGDLIADTGYSSVVSFFPQAS